jgi:hypothetical protein
VSVQLDSVVTMAVRVNSDLELMGNSGCRTVEYNVKLISVLDQQQW